MSVWCACTWLMSVSGLLGPRRAREGKLGWRSGGYDLGSGPPREVKLLGDVAQMKEMLGGLGHSKDLVLSRGEAWSHEVIEVLIGMAGAIGRALP